MYGSVERFTVKLAGVPIEIRCRYKDTKEFFSNYYSDEEPIESIEPDEDIFNIRVKAHYDRRAEMGIPPWDNINEVIENHLIMELLTDRLIGHNVLTMHGSALMMDGEAFIFTAPSGTGKSTHAALWREVFGDRCVMINDDKPYVLVDNGSITVYGSPFSGKHEINNNVSCKLKAIVRLRQAPDNSISKLESRDAFPIVCSQVIGCFPPDIMRRVLLLETEMIRSVDCFDLGCNMDREAAIVAWSGIHGTNAE